MYIREIKECDFFFSFPGVLRLVMVYEIILTKKSFTSVNFICSVSLFGELKIFLIMFLTSYHHYAFLSPLPTFTIFINNISCSE